MSSSVETAALALAARFLESREQGRRTSIDDLLQDLPDTLDRPAIRETALRLICRRIHVSGVSPSSEAAVRQASDPSNPLPGLPELEDYYIIDEIGRGGMGVVYEAYQRSTGRRVAVKFLLPTAKAAESVRRRFEREVELIARLQHPNVVSVLDSGLHRGRYYFVMEFVEGRPLNEALQPGVPQVAPALELLAAVAEAVDYAHQRGVLHRDLKPSNIMVDEAGCPHVLDFGLAKAIDPQAGVGVEYTLSEPGQVLGTLGYMSPEQSRGQLEQMSVRSDVYSLGVIGYELLTGEFPCRIDGPLQLVLRRLSDEPPARPSSRRPAIEADVDAMLLKALEKSPASRYSTAGEFAADLRRYLAGESILARRAGPARRAIRWAKRNRTVAAVAGAGLAAVMVITTAAFVWILSERDRALLAEQNALHEAERAGRVKEFLRGTLGYVDPDVAQYADVRFVDQLDHVASRVSGAFVGYPLEEAEVRHTLGCYYGQRACYAKAEGELRTAWSIRLAHLGEDHPDTAHTEYELAGILHAQDKYDEAESLYSSALETRKRRFGERSIPVAQVLNDWAWLLKDRGRYEQAEPLYRQALELRRELLGERHPEVAETLNDLGHVYYTLHDAGSAEEFFREALAIRQDPLDGRKSQVKIAATMASLGGVLTRLDRLDEAEPLLREALATRRRVLGERHADTIVSLNELGLLLREKEAYGEAEQLLREALELRKAVHGPGHSKVAVSLVNLGLVLQARGMYEEAEHSYEEALRILQEILQLGDHESVAAVLIHRANLQRELRDYDRAGQFAVQGLEMRRRLLGQADQRTTAIGDSEYVLGRITLERGDPAGAEPLLKEAFEILIEKRSPIHPITVRAQAALGASRLALGRFPEAEADLLGAFGVLSDRKPLPHRETLDILNDIIELYDRWGRPDQAEQYRRRLPEENGDSAPS